MRPIIGILLAAAASVSLADPPPAETPGVGGQPDWEERYLREVRPLLARKCLACHGDDPSKLRGGFDLRSRERAIVGGDSGEEALVPGKPDESSLLRAIEWKDESLRMPPKENDRLTAAEVELVRQWIAAGAVWPASDRPRAPGDAPNGAGVRIATRGALSDDWANRRYKPEEVWSFFPRRPVEVPWHALDDAAPRHPIDAFLRAKQAASGLAPAAPAERSVLLRRVAFGLTGLPPDAATAEAFLADDRADAYERLVDSLLASPRYGERMAQHWLDVVRYADTDGFSNDYERPHAWRWRDYVIRAFNADKPFDRFIVEQIAGDELAPDDPELKVAVGFLRMGPWEHTGMAVAAETRQMWLDDVTNAVGVTFLGQGLACARCHDHKFDPIPTADYYRVQAVFAATQFASAPAARLPQENAADAESNRRFADQIFAGKALEPLTKLEGDDAFGRIQKKRGEYHTRALQRYDAQAYSVATQGDQPVHILKGGSLSSPGERVAPGVLSGAATSENAAIPAAPQGRRLALARWIADGEHPLTARVIVNRVWQMHFGRGLVGTPNNFGVMGKKPTHPELLDWLADWFVANDWSIRKLNRLIVTAAAYRQSAAPADAARVREVDSENQLLSHFPIRRLSAEELRDAMLAASGELSTTAGGPGVYPEINEEVALQPRHIMGAIAPAYFPSPTREERSRRTIYAFRHRTLADPLLEVFNRPGSDASCERRDETTVAPQVFALFNSQYVQSRAVALAAAIVSQSDAEEERTTIAFRRVLGRDPTEAEAKAALAHLARMTEHHRRQPAVRRERPREVVRQMIAEQSGELFRWKERLDLADHEPDLKMADLPPDGRAVAELCLVLFNTSEFLHVY